MGKSLSQKRLLPQPMGFPEPLARFKIQDSRFKRPFHAGYRIGKSPLLLQSSPRNKTLPSAETEDDAGLDPHVVLMGRCSCAEVNPRVEVISLYHANGHIPRQLVVDSAPECHCEAVPRGRGAGDADRETCPAKQRLGKRLKATVTTISQPRPKYIGERMFAHAGAQAGHLATREFAYNPEVTIQVPSE